MSEPDSTKKADVEAVLGDGKASRWWQHRHLRRAAVAVALLALVALVWSLSGGKSTTRYLTEEVQRGDLTVVVTATGSVQPTNKVEVSSELSGIIRKVNVDYNSPVKVGDVLAELDTDKLEATVDAARAKVAAAKAHLREAEATAREKQREFVRKRDLAAQDIASSHDLDVAQAAHDRAVAAVESARADVVAAGAELKLAETNLEKACICSPINGVVLARNVDPGQTVASSFQAPVLFSIAEDLKQMELQVDVDEADVGSVKVGQPATFTVDTYPEREFPARIREVRYASEVVQGVVTYKAVLAIDNSELLLRPGMTATAEITVKEVDQALLVPNAALRYAPRDAGGGDQRSLLERILPGPPRFRPPSKREVTGRKRTLWLLRDGAPVPVEVEIGATDGRKTEIVSGDLEPGHKVITDQTTAGS